MFEDNSQMIIKQMKNAARRACRAAAKEIKTQAAESIPVRRGVTKKMLNHGATLSRSGGIAKGVVGYLKQREAVKKMPGKFVINASWLEFGTKVHVIQPNSPTMLRKRGGRNVRALADGKNIFGNVVAHPGAKRGLYLTKAGAKVAPYVNTIVAKEMDVLNKSTEELERILDDGNDDGID